MERLNKHTYEFVNDKHGETEKRNKRNKKHHKSRDDNPRNESILHNSGFEDDDYDHIGLSRDEENIQTVEEQKKLRKQPKEKKRFTHDETKKVEEGKHHGEVQSPLSYKCDYQFERATDIEVGLQSEESPLRDRQPGAQGRDDGKLKKKGVKFRKIFSPFKRKDKEGKEGKDVKEGKEKGQSVEQIKSNAEPLDPDSVAFDKSMKKIHGKSARDLTVHSARVILLDGEEVEIETDRKATGRLIFDKVCQDLDLLETDFFGMTYISARLQTWFWLDLDKKISKQIESEDWTVNFQVKFYPPEPALLQEDLTRYLLSLQVRQDVYTGKLPCSLSTQALLGSLMVQSELGDHDDLERHQGGGGPPIDYLREFEFVVNQSEQLLARIRELHRQHRGMLPDDADVKYLETARRLEQYGMDLHPARDNEDVEIFVGVGYQGILIYRDRLRIVRFAWPKVLRISYKKNYFYLKIRNDRYDDSIAVVGFRLLNHNLAKRLWKNAAEQHTFFRMKEPQADGASGSMVPSTSSTFSYSGKTLHQARASSITRDRPASVDRSLARRRTPGSMPAGLDRPDGTQYSSMHSLSRPHPRDMTLGRRRSGEHIDPRILAPLHAQGSIASDFDPSPRASFPTHGCADDDDGRLSARSGDSVALGESYLVTEDRGGPMARPVERWHSADDGLRASPHGGRPLKYNIRAPQPPAQGAPGPTSAASSARSSISSHRGASRPAFRATNVPGRRRDENSSVVDRL